MSAKFAATSFFLEFRSYWIPNWLWISNWWLVYGDWRCDMPIRFIDIIASLRFHLSVFIFIPNNLDTITGNLLDTKCFVFNLFGASIRLAIDDQSSATNLICSMLTRDKQKHHSKKYWNYGTKSAFWFHFGLIEIYSHVGFAMKTNSVQIFGG